MGGGAGGRDWERGDRRQQRQAAELKRFKPRWKRWSGKVDRFECQHVEDALASEKAYLEAGVAHGFGGAARGEKLHPSSREESGELHEPRLVGAGQQRAGDAAEVRGIAGHRMDDVGCGRRLHKIFIGKIALPLADKTPRSTAESQWWSRFQDRSPSLKGRKHKSTRATRKAQGARRAASADHMRTTRASIE